MPDELGDIDDLLSGLGDLGVAPAPAPAVAPAGGGAGADVDLDAEALLAEAAGAGGAPPDAGEPGSATAPHDPSDRAVDEDVARLLRLQLPVIVRLAQKPLRMEEVLNLTEGSLIQFAKAAEEPLDLMVNNICVGKGEVVKIGECFGLQVKEIGTPRETVQRLGGR